MSNDFFDLLGKPLTPTKGKPKQKNFVAAPRPLTLGEKVVSRFPSKHKDPVKAKEQERGLRSFVDFVVPQSKVDVGLTLATMGPIGRTIGRGGRAILEQAKPHVTRTGGGIFKIWDQRHMTPDEFKKHKPLTLVKNMTDEEKSTLAAGKKVGSLIKSETGQYREWVKNSQRSDTALNYTIEKTGKPFKTRQGRWGAEVKSAMSFDLETAPSSLMEKYGFSGIKDPQMLTDISFQYGSAMGTGSHLDHGRLLANVFDRFQGNWFVGNAEGNTFTIDSLNMMLKSVLRRADEIRFEPQSLTTYSPSSMSKVSKAANNRSKQIEKLRRSDDIRPTEFAETRADLDADYNKVLDQYAEEIIQTLWKSGKVVGAKSIDDVRTIADFGVSGTSGRIRSNRFMISSFKGDQVFSMQDYKYAIATVLGVKMSEVSGVLEQMFPDAE